MGVGMNFEWLQAIEQEMQFDEIRIIGKRAGLEEKPCYIAALLRRGDQLQVCIFKQENMPAYGTRENTMRASLREQAHMMESLNLQALIIDGERLMGKSGTGYYLQNSGPEAAVLLARLMQAGWQMPQDSVFYHMDWDQIMIMVYGLDGTYPKIPDISQARMSVLWMAEYRNYLLEQPFCLVVTDGEEMETKQQVAFEIPAPDGTKQEGVCYINRVELVDVWQEWEEKYADPAYQKQALQYVSAEEFEETKRMLFETLGYECPRGMFYIGISYECTLDVSLDFYSREYLDSPQKICGQRASFLLTHSKPDSETGSHGLKMQAAVIRVPVPYDTKEIQAELFLARRTIPEREETLIEKGGSDGEISNGTAGTDDFK